MDYLIGRTVGPYRILEPLGTGGMAVVYKAYEPSRDRYVALKVPSTGLARDSDFRSRFAREAQTIARLEHPHVLPVYDFGEDDDVPYLAMRYVDAGTLKDVLATGPLPLDQALSLVCQVADALGYAHRQGIIHRDVKPANILLDQDGSALLSDFGIAKLLEETLQLTHSGVALGTPFYMAPEQVLGKPVDGRADIYALGVILYEALTGRRPFVADTPLAVAFMHVNDPLPLPRTVNPKIPEEVERIILRMLAKNPNDRYARAETLAAALRSVQGYSASSSRGLRLSALSVLPASASVFRWLPSRAGSPVAGLVVGAVVVAALMAGVMSGRLGGSLASSHQSVASATAESASTSSNSVPDASLEIGSPPGRLPADSTPGEASTLGSRSGSNANPGAEAAAGGLSPAASSSSPASTRASLGLATSSLGAPIMIPATTAILFTPIPIPPTATLIPVSPSAPSPSPTPLVPSPTTVLPSPTALPPSPTTPLPSPTPVPPSPTRVPPTATLVPSTPIPPSPAPAPPTPTPVPSYPPPVLIAATNQPGSIVLSWTYRGQLGPNDYFDVRVWSDGQPERGVANVQSTTYTIGGGFPGGTYNWTIAVITKQNGVIRTQSLAAQTLRFTWTPAGGGGGGGGGCPVPPNCF